ncbi:MFS transporter OS=Streptomyces rimosus subsp. rimosus (strain ATCC / DSM 40260 / JCM 4667 /NRRL 2234) OX=1265868 GN=SRIM_016640 PE=4 SV=1 [Streptomyces rimosus subsp. rimosus]
MSLEVLAASGSPITPGEAWALGQIHWRTRIHGETSLAAIARAHRMPEEVLEPIFTRVVSAGYARHDGGRLVPTEAGRTEIDRLIVAWRDWLDHRLEGWTAEDPEDRARLARALDNMAARLLDEDSSHRERTAV